MTPIRLMIAAAQALAALATAYLVALLGAAALDRRRRGVASAVAGRMRFVVLMPAHNEEQGIGATLAALDRIANPRDRRETVVIADNCSDATADVAERAGATVLVRSDPDRRGKGHALAWALDPLDDRGATADAIVVLDADCEPSANLLGAIERRLRDGAAAVQVDYAVANPGAS